MRESIQEFLNGRTEIVTRCVGAGFTYNIIDDRLAIPMVNSNGDAVIQYYHKRDVHELIDHLQGLLPQIID